MEAVAAFPVKMEAGIRSTDCKARSVSHTVVGENHTIEDWAAVCSADWQTHPSQCVRLCVCGGAVSLGAWESAALI